jgi:4-amino-4-deoxy-L-arabinose transferase-like glycosyltransferase
MALLLFVPFLGSVHLFDWDEINFAECAREMIVTGNYFSVKINFQPFWEKPPLFIWMQALSMNMFGVNEFSARLPNAICGVVTLLVIFNIGRKLYDQKFAWIWVLAYVGSFLPHFYFKSGIIDPWFNLFIFSGIYYFILFKNNKNIRLLLLSSLLIGLGVLTKGPVSVLIVGLCIAVYWVSKKFEPVLNIKQIIVYGFTIAFVGGLWFLLLIATGNSSVIKEFFMYQVRLFSTQDSGHGGFFFYHWIILLIGCFPMSVFALSAFKTNTFDTPYQKYFKLWMLILFWVVLILFSIVKTKIVHYSSLCYFPLSYLGAYSIYKMMNGELEWKKWNSVILMTIASIMGIVISILPLLDKYKIQIIEANIIKDKFGLENIKANVQWSGFEWWIGVGFIIGIAIMLWLIKKKQLNKGLIGVFIVSLLTVNLASIVITPRIELYSQNAAIEFYHYLQEKDCYVETINFKSYAYLFYSRKKEQTNKKSVDIDWLLHGKIDKPAYFVCKITALEEVNQDYPNLKEIYRKNGFVFFVRVK